MDMKKIHTVGSVRVSEEVLLKIAETAACEVDGTACVGSKLIPAGPREKLRGTVRAKINGETAAIRLDISVKEGFNAVTVCENIQKSVKSAVQNMTGFTVTKVDVNVASIVFDNAPENPKAEAASKAEAAPKADDVPTEVGADGE